MDPQIRQYPIGNLFLKSHSENNLYSQERLCQRDAQVRDAQSYPKFSTLLPKSVMKGKFKYLPYAQMWTQHTTRVWDILPAIRLNISNVGDILLFKKIWSGHSYTVTSVFWVM